MNAVVCGSSGYVGRHLVRALAQKGLTVRAASRSSQAAWAITGVEYMDADFSDFQDAQDACGDAEQVYNLAAMVGGIGFIEKNKFSCLACASINLNILQALRPGAAYLFTSSSCVYPSQATPAFEASVQPGLLGGYALEKYFSEQACFEFAQENPKVQVQVARLHTIYGPGDHRGHGRDHFISALVDAVIDARMSGVHEIKIWGDGNQTRSLLYIDDAVEGLQRIIHSTLDECPTNLANSDSVSVNQVVSVLEEIAAIKLTRFYAPGAPTGRQNKTSDNTRLKAALGWEPSTPLRKGLEATYRSAWDRKNLR